MSSYDEKVAYVLSTVVTQVQGHKSVSAADLAVGLREKFGFASSTFIKKLLRDHVEAGIIEIDGDSLKWLR